MRTLYTILITCLLSLIFVNIVHAQWVQMKLDSIKVEKIKVDSSNLYVWTNNGCYLSTDGGMNWSFINWNLIYQRLYPSLIAHDLTGGTTFYQSVGDVLFYSTNQGISWDSAMIPDCYMKRMTANPSESGVGIEIFVETGCPRGGGGGLFLSTNNGINWSDLLWFGFPLAFVDTGINKKIYIGLDGGEGPGGISLSTDNGMSWNDINAGLYDSIRYRSPFVSSILQIGTYLFAGTEWGIYLTTNSGTNWTPINNGLPQGYNLYNTLQYNPVTQLVSSGTNIFALIASTTTSIYLTTNNGLSWTNVSGGLPDSIYIDELAVDELNLYAITHTDFVSQVDSDGVWKKPLSEILSVGTQTTELPVVYTLYQNYPNPFNPSTTIKYQLPTQSQVKLKVFDVLGREVATLVNGVEEPGYKSVNLNVSKLASGVYYYRLQARPINGGQAGSPSSSSGQCYIETKKLLLLK